jgi:cytochrome c oxidase assembly protein subunit 11
VSAVATPLQSRNRRVGLLALCGALAMLGLGYASAPLYRMFCQVTGFAGTTQRVTEEQAAKVSLAKGEVVIRFDSNIERGMPWQFRPTQVSQKVQLGGRHFTSFIARNMSDKPVTGRASFNVTPDQAGKYFNKIQCFCFTEQTLQPGQEVNMPVVFYVDPKIKDDPDAKDIDEITLSYTFHPVATARTGG